MNMQLRTRLAPHKKKFNPRLDILDEVVAGIFWMSLDLPDDASMTEIAEFAHHLVQRARAGASASVLEAEIDFLQRRQFCRPADAAVIGDLAQRTIALVAAA